MKWPFLKIPALFFAFSISCASAQNWNQIIKSASNTRTLKSPAGRTDGDNFGSSVAIDGDYAVVGVGQEDEDTLGGNTLLNAGGVFIFKQTGGIWSQVKKIVATDRGFVDLFGASVAISGTTIVVSAVQEDEDAAGTNTVSNAGAVYIFSKDAGGPDNWGQVKKIVASDRAVNDNFGFRVAISDSIVVATAFQEDEDATGNNTQLNAGSAYIFSRNQGGVDNWGQVKKIVAPDRAANDYFGWSVAIDNNTIAIGSNREDEDGAGGNTRTDAGSVYLFYKDYTGINAWGNVKKIVASDRGSNDYFGAAVAVSGNVMVVGANEEDHDVDGLNNKPSAGAAYLFSRNLGGTDNWGEIKKIVASDRGTNDFFGQSVSISGNNVVVAALIEDEDASGVNTQPDAGSAYVFSKDQGGIDNWGQAKKIVAADRSIGDRFGTSIAISGNTIISGATYESEDVNGNNFRSLAGSSYIFNKDVGGADTWGQQQKIVMADGVANQYYGISVAVDGDYAVVGASGDFPDAAGGNHLISAGAAYILKNTNGVWTPVKRVVASDRARDDRFGISVSISGNIVVVGASNEDEDAVGLNTKDMAGAAYIFSKDQGGTDNWGQVKKLVASDRNVMDYFGYNVSVSGNVVVIGAYGEDEDAGGVNTKEHAGSAYIFSKDQGGTNNWGQVKKIVAPQRTAFDQFGYALAIGGNTLVVGAYGDDVDAEFDDFLMDAGSAYIFSKDQGGVNNWGQVKKIVPSDRDRNNVFGRSIGISGTTIVVGASGEAQGANGGNAIDAAGAAYLFSQNKGGANNWGEVKKIVAADRATQDYFATSVGISGNTVVAGAYRQDKDASGGTIIYDAGAAYLFSKDKGGIDNWGQVRKLIAADRAAEDNFGFYVAINAGNVIVGAYTDDETIGASALLNTGAAYFFPKSCDSISLPTASSSVTATQTLNTTYTNDICNILANVAATGANPISSEVTAKVWIEPAQTVAYAKRHYEITPATNLTTATGEITLYFTQADFNSFNAVNTTKLPVDSNDSTGKANLRIDKKSGTSSNGTGLPATYAGPLITIDPVDSAIVWNTGMNRWEVRFEVTGFSGFFLTSYEKFQFSGIGNWSDSSKWMNGKMPPFTINNKAEIVITAGSICTYDLPQNQAVAAGAKLTVETGANLIMNNLNIVR